MARAQQRVVRKSYSVENFSLSVYIDAMYRVNGESAPGQVLFEVDERYRRILRCKIYIARDGVCCNFIV